MEDLDSELAGMLEEARLAWLEALGEHQPNHLQGGEIDKFLSLGSKGIHACAIDEYEGGMANTGHLVIELPDEKDRRREILIEIDRIVRKQGFDGNLDDGQRLEYVRLD